MTKAIIKKSILSGTITAPPSKSLTHRYLICAFLAGGTSEIKNVIYSEDVKATIKCLKEFGCEIKENSDSIIISNQFNLKDSYLLDCNESGSTLRFLIPYALSLGKKVKFTGTKKLLSRPLNIYEKLCNENNWAFDKKEDCLIIEGKLKTGEYKIDGNVSSQFISGMIFALVKQPGVSKIVIENELESRPYIDLTVDALRKIGAHIDFSGNLITIDGNSQLHGAEFIVEGDESNASTLDCYNFLDGDVEVLGLNSKTLQGDSIYKNYMKMMDGAGSVISLKNCPDLGPILMAMASLKNGMMFVDIGRLRDKESDRIDSIRKELSKCGVKVIELNNSVIIEKTNIHKPTEEIESHNDHRIVMAMTTILSVIGGTINGIEAVNKSYPNYFEDLKKLGLNIEIIEEK